MDPYARLRDPSVWPRLVAGAACCDRGEWWAAHEEWEQAWRGYRESDRVVIQGLIQLVAVNWHLGRGALGPARQVLARAVVHLAGHDRRPWPFALPPLIADGHRLADTLSSGASGAPLRLALSAALRVATR